MSLQSTPSAGKPLANTVSECEANDQSDCNFQHWESLEAESNRLPLSTDGQPIMKIELNPRRRRRRRESNGVLRDGEARRKASNSCLCYLLRSIYLPV